MDPSDCIAALLRCAVPEIAADYYRVNTATTGNFCGEKLLMMALLEDAINVLDCHVTAGTYSLSRAGRDEPRREALHWFMSDDEDWIFSFVNVCDHLGLDFKAVRAAVLAKMKKAA